MDTFDIVLSVVLVALIIVWVALEIDQLKW